MGEHAVGAEVSDGDATRAHALIDLGEANARTLSLCGMPVEHLAVVPEMTWDEVDPGSRCPHCQDDVVGRAADP